ncbi:hypothetical protein Tco_0340733 [Tanacetum coccineum]
MADSTLEREDNAGRTSSVDRQQDWESQSFAPFARWEADQEFCQHMRTRRSFPIYQMDVKMAYLNGPFKEEESGFELTTFSDADHAGCVDHRKSTSGGIQFLEAEYVALSASCAQVMWLRTQLQDYGFNYNKIPLYCDSQSAIAISCNPVQHSRTKYIHTRYYFIKEQVENGIIELYFVRTEYQLDDMFTKALSEDRLGISPMIQPEPTKIELTLEQSQQCVSNDVLVSIEGVEELKRNVWIKGEKKEALHIT